MSVKQLQAAADILCYFRREALRYRDACKLPCLTSLVAGRCFQVIRLITLWLFMFCHNYFIFYATKRFLSAIEIKCIRVASSKDIALISLIPYLDKIIFCVSDWTAAPAKKPEHGS